MIKTAEAVSPAHPDKMADQIADLALTKILKADPTSRVALEVLGGHGRIHIMGEVTTQAGEVGKMIGNSADEVLAMNRYNPLEYDVDVHVAAQSPDIARGVDVGGAGDQGIMVGYACRDNEAMIPQELFLAREILKALWENENSRDAKSQVTIDGDTLLKIVVSAEQLKRDDILAAVLPIIRERGLKVAEGTFEILTNPAGEWENGGFAADTGLTGRKIAYDNYGPQVEIGGGCFSGKDPTKVDRSGAYAARRMACDLLRYAAPEVREVKVKVAYAIGVAMPVMLTAQYDGGEVQDMLAQAGHMFTPDEMIKSMKLREQDYLQVARWGSFGHAFPWE